MIFYREEKPPDQWANNWKNPGKSTPRNPQESQIPDGTTTWVGESPWLLDRQDQKNKAVKLEQPAVPNNPGSGKVIPEGHGFENKRSAAQIVNILNKTDPKVRERAAKLKPVLVSVNRDETIWRFKVSDYDVFLEVVPKALGIVRSPSKADILVSCSCPFWQYQGPEYWAVKDGYQYGSPKGNAAPPKVRDPQGVHRICKHVVACFDKIKKEKGRNPFSVLWERIKGLFRKSHYIADNGPFIGEETPVSLRTKTIRLAYDNPGLRADLLPLLRTGFEIEPDDPMQGPNVRGWQKQVQYKRVVYVKNFDRNGRPKRRGRYSLSVGFGGLGFHLGVRTWDMSLVGVAGKRLLQSKGVYSRRAAIPAILVRAEKAALHEIEWLLSR